MDQKPEWLSHTELQDPEVSAELAHVDFHQPNIARMYDYHLNGNANFAVDRAAADELERIFPGNRGYAARNRGFLWRAVRTLTREYGLDQFLDLGSGVPTVGNVHEIAHQYNPAARVAYVDWESIAVYHARRMLGTEEQRVTVTQADVADPAEVLSAPGVAGLLDFTRPVAVFALGILDILHTPDAASLLGRYRDACVSGSALAISNTAELVMSPQQLADIEELMRQTSTPQVHTRSRNEIRDLFAGYDLLEPGVVPTAAWRPDHPTGEQEANRSNAYAAVGIVRGDD